VNGSIEIRPDGTLNILGVVATERCGVRIVTSTNLIVNPFTQKKALQNVVEQAIECGMIDEIRSFSIGPTLAACLYLEGVITKTDIARATVFGNGEGNEEVEIDIYLDTSLGNREVKLTVNRRENIIALDGEGRMISG
jgi:hypothetical protein